MWDGIAFSQLGNDAYADRIMNLNQQYLGYYIFPAGIKLNLPEITPETSGSLPPWKRVDQ